MLFYGKICLPIVKKINNIPFKADYGIDLFKVDDNMKITEAFQVKCYEKTKNITFKTLFNFFFIFSVY